jgi:hypothetical protein
VSVQCLPSNRSGCRLRRSWTSANVMKWYNPDKGFLFIGLRQTLIMALGSIEICWHDLGSVGTRKHSARCWIPTNGKAPECQKLTRRGPLGARPHRQRAAPPPPSPLAQAFECPAIMRISRQECCGSGNFRGSVPNLRASATLT